MFKNFLQNLKKIDFIISLSAMFGQGIRFKKLYFYHVALLFSLFSFYKKFKTKDLTLNPLIGLFILWPMISLAWSPDIKMGLKEVFHIFLGTYFLVYNPESRWLKRSILIVFWVNIIISCIEGFGIYHLPTSVLFQESFLDAPTGFHWNQNTNALFIIMFCPIVLSFHRSWARSVLIILSSFVIYKIGSKLTTVPWLIFLFWYLLQQFKKAKLTHAAIVVASLGLLTFVIARHEIDSRRLQKYERTATVFQLFITSAFKIVQSRAVDQAYDFDHGSYDASLQQRLVLFDGLITIIKENFWIGAGPGSLYSKVNRRGSSEFTLKLESPHFYFLEVWGKYGAFYFLFYLGILIFILCKLYTKNRYAFFALGLFIFFNPIVSSASYFLPKWVLFRHCLNELNIDAKPVKKIDS